MSSPLDNLLQTLKRDHPEILPNEAKSPEVATAPAESSSISQDKIEPVLLSDFINSILKSGLLDAQDYEIKTLEKYLPERSSQSKYIKSRTDSYFKYSEYNKKWLPSSNLTDEVNPY